jgi:tryptophan synthase alpha chain
VSRIPATFAALRASGRVALVPFFTAGDPDLATTRALVLGAVAEGADVIELGVPFSDPMADGPVLQRSAHRAIAAGTSLMRILELVADLRRDTDVPLVLFGYYNPLLHYGLERIARDAATAGADAFLCVDLPPEEDAEFRAAARAAGLDLIRLIAPTTPPARIHRIAAAASGFLYCVSVLGVTGGRDALPPELPELVARVRRVTDLPVGVGFGVQRPEQAAWIAGFADAVVVGSAIARIVETTERGGVVERVTAFVRELRVAMLAASARRTA